MMERGNEFIFKMQVYAEDTDSVGIVHHANLIKFMERARTAWLLKLGFRLDQLYSQGIFFVIKHISIDYINPAKMYDELEIISRMTSVRRIMKIYEQTIRHANDPTKIYCTANIQVVCVNNHLRPQAMPPELVESMQ
jgi:acyl-CoA thioester hydrolase